MVTLIEGSVLEASRVRIMATAVAPPLSRKGTSPKAAMADAFTVKAYTGNVKVILKKNPLTSRPSLPCTGCFTS